MICYPGCDCLLSTRTIPLKFVYDHFGYRRRRPAGTGGDFSPSMIGVNSGYPRLEVGAVGVAPWQQ